MKKLSVFRWLSRFMPGAMVVGGALWLGQTAFSSTVAAGEVNVAVDFQRDIRPILSGHCFKCHGPDGGSRKAGLRLDKREAAVGEGSSEEGAIVPGKPELSELVRRVWSEDSNETMPPPETKHPLNERQKVLLREWVEQGAVYEPHWAFIPPKEEPLPKVEQASWPKNEIDYFVLARLEEEGLKPAEEADARSLVRRVYLDLVGFPPKRDEVEAFLKDPSPQGYEALVDRLLASPHYGERWARRWLDLARYADTNGYEKDRERSIWPYRDWVIEALNRDMPFDEFSILQLAGDMVPEAGAEGQVATGFHRNTMLNEEGGIDPLEYRFYAMVDRVNTTATTWLGLTMACAQCHTHKYDPIEQEEYYEFMAFLNNADEPELTLRDENTAEERARLLERIGAMEASLPGKFPLPESADEGGESLDVQEREALRKRHLEERFNEWLEEKQAEVVPWTVLEPVSARSNLPLLTILEDQSVWASGDQSKRDVYEVRYRVPLDRVSALRIEVLPDERLPKRGPGRVYYEGPHGDFFLSELECQVNGSGKKFKAASESFSRANFVAEKAMDGDPQTGWSIDGAQGSAQTAVFVFEEPLEQAEAMELKFLFERYYAAGLGRFKVSATDAVREAQASSLPLELQSLLAQPREGWSEEDLAALRKQFLRVTPLLKEAREQIEEMRGKLPDDPTTLVMAERPANNPRATHLYRRGEFLQPVQEVSASVPEVLHPFPGDWEKNRLNLARWLVSPENPLVGRVVMNRHWAVLFGTGLVKTVQDFGLQGELPSHPALLDWLALEFVRRDWSIKQMHKLMVMSATYRQKAEVSRRLLELDPENRLLARSPRVRLEAELVRDSVLRAAGLLSLKIGGPSVFPPQPPGVTTEGTYGALQWKTSEGTDRYRRGLYTFSKRTAPYAAFATFDAPSGEACLALREISNSPLQALTVLNDEVFVEAARALGKAAAGRDGSSGEVMDWLFETVLSRRTTAEEQRLCLEYRDRQRARLEAGELDAAAICGREKAPVEEAAWTLVSRVLLNLDETITKD